MSPYFGLNLGQLLACFVSGVFAEQTARGAAVRAHALLGAVAVCLREWRCADDDSRGADAMLLLSRWARLFRQRNPALECVGWEHNCATGRRTRSRALLRGWADAKEKETMADTPATVPSAITLMGWS